MVLCFKFQKKPEYTPPAPITHPLFGVAPQNEQQPLPTNNGYPYMPGQSYEPAPPMQPAPNKFAPPVQHTYQPSPPTPKPRTPEPPKSKGPVPEEHMYLQTVFDELRSQCTCAANNPVNVIF